MQQVLIALAAILVFAEGCTGLKSCKGLNEAATKSSRDVAESYSYLDSLHKTRDSTITNIRAQELYSLYERDEAKANGIFKNRKIAVVGIIAFTRKGIDNNMHIHLAASENGIKTIDCSVSPRIAKGLKAGQQIVIKGICKGMFAGTVLLEGE